MKSIKTEEEYNDTLNLIEPLLKKGFDNLTEEEDGELIYLTNLLEEYENVHYPIPFDNLKVDKI